MSKSPVKPALRNGDQNTKSAPRRGSPDFCLLINRDTRSRLFTKATSAAKFTAVHAAAPMIADVFKDVYKGQMIAGRSQQRAQEQPEIRRAEPVEEQDESD